MERSAGNKGQLEGLLTGIERLAMDVSDTASEKAAFIFLSRCVTAWGRPETLTDGANGAASAEPGLPGFDQFIYKQLVPVAFQVLSLPQFNIKDGQIMVVRPPLRVLLHAG
jgi:exportin-T